MKQWRKSGMLIYYRKFPWYLMNFWSCLINQFSQDHLTWSSYKSCCHSEHYLKLHFKNGGRTLPQKLGWRAGNASSGMSEYRAWDTQSQGREETDLSINKILSCRTYFCRYKAKTVWEKAQTAHLIAYLESLPLTSPQHFSYQITIGGFLILILSQLWVPQGRDHFIYPQCP